MSNFKIFLLYYIMLIIIIHLSYHFTDFSENNMSNYNILSNLGNSLFIVFSGIFTLVTLIFIGELGELYPIKYRITQYNNNIEVSVLQFSYHIIPKWESLDSRMKKSGNNLDGTKRDFYVNCNTKYNSYQEALDAIQQHRDRLVKMRNDLYKKNTDNKENKPKVTYL